MCCLWSLIFLLFGIVLCLWLCLRVFLWFRNSYKVPGKEGYEECILITGCDSGIGRNTALRLCKNGYTVFAACLFEKSFSALLDESASFSGTIVPIQVDIRKEASVQNMARAVDSELQKSNRRLFAVVNNAGVITNGPIEMQTMQEVEFQFDVNVLGQVRVIQETTKFIRESGGRIVNTVSVAGRTTTGALGAYSGSKHAMEAITDAIRFELKPWKVSVSAIEPGVIDTELARSMSRNVDMWNKLRPGATEVYPLLQKQTERTGKLGIIGEPVDTVTDAIMHAITSAHPKTRYLVGADAKLLAFLKWACSDRTFDIISELSPVLADMRLKQKQK